MLYFFDINKENGVLMQKHIKILDKPIKLKRVEKWAKPLTFIRMFAYLTLRRFSGCRLYKDCFATGDFSVNAKSKEIGKELDELFAKVKTPRGFLELYTQTAYDVPEGFIPLASFNIIMGDALEINNFNQLVQKFSFAKHPAIYIADGHKFVNPELLIDLLQDEKYSQVSAATVSGISKLQKACEEKFGSLWGLCNVLNEKYGLDPNTSYNLLMNKSKRKSDFISTILEKYKFYMEQLLEEDVEKKA